MLNAWRQCSEPLADIDPIGRGLQGTPVGKSGHCVLAAGAAGVAQFEVQIHVPGMDGQTPSHRQGTGLVCLRACGLTVPWSCSGRRGPVATMYNLSPAVRQPGGGGASGRQPAPPQHAGRSVRPGARLLSWAA